MSSVTPSSSSVISVDQKNDKQSAAQMRSKNNQRIQRTADTVINVPGLQAALPSDIITRYVAGVRGKVTTRLMRGAIAHIKDLHAANAMFVNAGGEPNAVELKTPSGAEVDNIDEGRIAEYRARAELQALVPEHYHKVVQILEGEMVGRTIRAATLYIASF